MMFTSLSATGPAGGGMMRPVVFVLFAAALAAAGRMATPAMAPAKAVALFRKLRRPCSRLFFMVDRLMAGAEVTVVLWRGHIFFTEMWDFCTEVVWPRATVARPRNSLLPEPGLPFYRSRDV